MYSRKDNYDIAHEWARDWKGEEAGTAANMFYANGCIYSYGSHFMIARHVHGVNNRHAVLMTENTYSRTTAKHIAIVRNACSHYEQIQVADPKLPHEALFLRWHEQMKDLAQNLGAAKKPGKSLLLLKAVFAEAKKYADFFGLELPVTIVDMGAISSREQFQAHWEAEKQLQEKVAEKERKKRKKLFAARLTAWRAHETNDLYGRDGWDYLRCNPKTGAIETTQSVDIPLTDGQAFYRQILAIVDRGGCSNCNFLFMHQYPVLEINKQYIRVGCHQISLKEINRFANAQGW